MIKFYKPPHQDGVEPTKKDPTLVNLKNVILSHITFIRKYNKIILFIMGQLSALFYKNWLIYKRAILGNVLQFLIPIFFICFIVMVRLIDPITTYTQQSYIGTPLSASIDHSTPATSYMKRCSPQSIVVLVPAANPLVTQLNTKLSVGYPGQVRQFASQSYLQSYVTSQDYQNTPSICFAIVVDSSTAPNYQYKLRFNMSTNTANTDGPSSSIDITEDSAVDFTLYNRSLTQGMIGATTLVNTQILQLASGGSQIFQNNVSPFYQQDYIKDNIYANLASTIGIITLLPLLLIYLRQTSSMLNEKQTKVRQSMSIMGMKMSHYYFTWFIRYFVVMVIVHLICSIIIARTLPYVTFIVPFIIFILFDIVLIVQNFFIQVFLSRAKIGVVISLLFFVLQYVLSLISTNSDNPTIGVNSALSIIPHAAFIFAFQSMLYFQSYQITADFKSVGGNYVIGYALASFILNIIFYSILAWYLDQVVPNQWGAKRHPLFCCYNKTAPYSVQEKEIKKREEMESEGYADTHEPLNQNQKALEKDNKVIQIVGLRKEYPEVQTVAVKNLTINMFNNQIFALLGHNGAGKTTTISMLTGMIDPSAGYISVFGQTQFDKIRAMIGVCPQHDTLFEDLTVEEHLSLFGSFKGLEGEQLDREVLKLINDVNLSEKKDQYAKNLSGGQKRRLSVALAFTGRSKVIILDEPTSGMDTSARRYIWELLKTYKNDRIIILTTHFMDEADYLGDRIGIMGDGQMICCGSSIYLKNKYGVGYNITFVKESIDVNSNHIIDIVKKYIPDAKVLSNVATDLSIQLPMHDVKRFSELFKQIDDKKKELKFCEYGISVTTLEEVFLKVGQQLDQDHAHNHQLTHQVITQQKQMKMINSSQVSPQLLPSSQQPLHRSPQTSEEGLRDNYDNITRQNGSCIKFLIHFKATFLKRLRVIRRDLKSFIFQLALPIVIMIFAMLLMRISFLTSFSSQTINLSLYLDNQNPVVIPIGSDNAGYLSTLSTGISSKYGSKVSVRADSTDTTAATFDYNYLLPIQKQQSTLLGGIFFENALNTDPVFKFNTLVSTRTPTSVFYLQTLAAETILINVLGKPATTSITVISYPLPRTYQQSQINNTISGFFGSFIFTLALAFKFASIMSFIVKQREDRSKHQQIVSGMNIAAYWLSNFVFDYFLYMIVAAIGIGLCKALSISSLTDGNAYTGVILLFIFYGSSYIFFTYSFAFLFKDYGNAQAGYYFLTFIVGGMLPILTFLLRILGTGSNPVGRGLAWVLRLYPSFAFGEGILNIGSVSLYGNNQNNGKKMDALAAEVGLAPVLYLAIGTVFHAFVLFGLELLQKNESFMRCFTSQHNITDTKEITETDVLEEYQKANAADENQYEILTKRLRKVYMIDSEKKHKIAVDNLSVAIRKGEVFGLLGVNGAGKSTTFKMLSGEITSTAGDSYFMGMKISDNLDKVRQGLGYCPQFDALIQNLTVREQLQLFYDLKSLKGEYKDIAITKKIEQMNLEEYENKLSGTLSGGNKRKLSVAMAMIGNPRIVFLDEPSTGMDPKARRFMWKVISRVATEKKNTTVILTTHSMEQAQALSTRLGIMVKGNFQCIGTPQHIKSKYGEGFEIEIKLNVVAKEQIIQYIVQKKLGNVQLVKKNDLQKILDTLGADPEDRLQISEHGAGNYILNTLESTKSIELFVIAEFIEICNRQRIIMNEMRKLVGEVQLIEKLQTFMRLKIKKLDRVSKLFEFFQNSKVRLGIQQYMIKQATVEQIFNHFAQGQEGTQYGP